MSDEMDKLLAEEAETFEREVAVAEMEAQLHQQAQGIIDMEHAFLSRTDALRNLLSFVAEQEKNLVARAEAIGPRAGQLVEPLLGHDADSGKMTALETGIAEERRVWLERRQELLEARMQLVEEREASYGSWYEKLEVAESSVGEMEEKLLQRELEIGQALRKLITSASELSGPLAEAPEAVVAAEEPDGEGPHRSRNRASTYTTQVRFNLKADVGGDEKHGFFRYEDDEAGELPGLFVATTNLLKEDREVAVDIGVAGRRVPAKGVVAWRRKPGENEGEPGMGIELTWLRDEDREVLLSWVAEHAPEVV